VNFARLFEAVHAVLPQDKKIYLVGGAVRDSIVGRPVHDLDFGMVGDCRKVAQVVARKLHSPFYILDDQRLTTRVLFRPAVGEEYSLDFISLFNDNLEEDLLHRDFSINAIAVEIQTPHSYIDPCKGESDLRNKILRACSPDAMLNDPLRVMRGIRFAIDLELRIQPETLMLMQQAVPKLLGVSLERQRDELFRILNGSYPIKGIQMLATLGALEVLFNATNNQHRPEQEIPNGKEAREINLPLFTSLVKLVDGLSIEDSGKKGNPLVLDAISRLRDFRDNFANHFAREFTPGRPLRGLVLLSVLDKQASRLMLSNAETDYLKRINQNRHRIAAFIKNQENPSRREIFHFFQDTGEAGIDICLLFLSEMVSSMDASEQKGIWEFGISCCQILFDAWWRKQDEIIHPAILLDGEEIKSFLHLNPGPVIGQLLDKLLEAQAAGEVSTRNQALDFIRTQKGLLVKFGKGFGINSA
jgi:poly(A) polymerase